MDAQDIRNLQEAYLGVYENNNNEPDPFGRPGGKYGGVKKGGGYEKGYNAMMKKIKELDKKEEYDFYDIILSHLLDEGYAETSEAAQVIMVNMSEEWRQSIVEAEGSYGQTPTARKAYGDLANKRRATPASGFSQRGEKTKKVKSAEKHFNRTGNPDAGNRGKKSTKPSFHSGKRSGMTQSDRDYSRGEAEYGHTGYDPDFDGGPSGPGGKPKGKKAERQKKTGVSAD
jgi:hypothetical protein